MKKVSNQVYSLISATIVIVLVASTVFVNPGSAQALTVSYSLSSNVKISNPASTIEPSTSYSISLPDSASKDDTSKGPVITYSLSNSSTVAEPDNTEVINNPELPADPVNNSQTSNQANQKLQREKVVIAEGTKYATDLYIIKSGKPGPVVMVVGGVHGNETAGYSAADKIKDLEIDKGTLLVLPQANKRAVERDVRYISSEGDLNRDFPKTSSETPDTTLARAIYNVLKEYDVDWLADLHEGYDYYKNESTDSVGQTLIYYPANSTCSTVSKIVDSLNSGISSSYKEFSLLRYPVKGSLARSAGQFLDIHSFIFETCDNPSLSTRVNYHMKAVKKLLSEIDMI